MNLVSKVHQVLLCVGNQLARIQKVSLRCLGKDILLNLGLRSLEPWFRNQLVHPLLEASFHLLAFSSNNHPYPRVSKANVFCLFFPSLLPNHCATSVRQGLVSESLN